MTEKDFNRAILAELAKIANDYFSELSIPAGTYTASELASGKKGKEEIKMSAPYEIKGAKHIVSVDSFRCEFPSERVFWLVSKFEKLSGVGQKGKMHFVRMAEPENVVCSFSADFGKGIKWAANHVTNDDDATPAMRHALLNLERSELVATDGQILSVTNVPVTGLCGKRPGFPVLLNLEMIKNLKGKCHMQVLRGGITVEDESGKQYAHNYELKRYPNYITVIPVVSGELRATFTPASVKSIFSLLKSAKKECEELRIDIEADSHVAKIAAVNHGAEISSICVKMPCVPTCDIHMSTRTDYFARLVNWDGNIWFGCDNSRALVLGDKISKLTLMMPVKRSDGLGYRHNDKTSFVNAFEAVSATKTPEPVQTTAAPEKAAETPNLPAPYVVSEVSAVSFAESFANLMAFLFAFFFEAETRRLLERLEHLAGLAGKPLAELVPGPSGEPVAGPVVTIPPEPKQESPVPLGRLGRCWGGWGKSPLQGLYPAGVAGAMLGRQCQPAPSGRIVARTVFPAIFAPSRARRRIFAPPGIHSVERLFWTRNRGAKRIVCRAALSPPRETHSAKPCRGMAWKANRPSRPPPETNQ